MSDKPVVFFHVMKCGGTSVRAGLAEGVAGRRHGHDVFELNGDAAKYAAAGNDQDNWRFRDALLPYVLTAMEPAIVLGHFRYRDRYKDLLDRAHFVTVLRDPVERVVSLYRYRRYKETVDLPVSIPFIEYVESPRWSREGHAYVRTFCGDDGLDQRSEEAVAATIENLRRFAAVGFVDQLERFSDRINQLTGRKVSIPRLNPSPAPAASLQEGVDPRALERAREMCAPDLEVYEQLRAEQALGAAVR
jgi:hypothetical protein